MGEVTPPAAPATEAAAHAATVRTAVMASMAATSVDGYSHADFDAAYAALAALVSLVAATEQQRDEALRDWQMYVHEVTDEMARAEDAERRAAETEAALHQIQAVAVMAQSPTHVDDKTRLSMLNEIEQIARAALSGGGPERTTT